MSSRLETRSHTFRRLTYRYRRGNWHGASQTKPPAITSPKAMVEPLSIAASVAGLLSLTGAIYTQLSDFVQQVKDVPRSAHALLMAVSEMRMVITSVSDLLNGLIECPPKRRALVQIDHLILTLTQTVITAAEVEQFLSRWQALYDPKMSRYWRIRLVPVENKANKLVDKLRGNMSSISLVLNILQCESDMDAQADRHRLDEALDATLPEVRPVLSGRSTLTSLSRRQSRLGSDAADISPPIPSSAGGDGGEPADDEAQQIVVFDSRRSFESTLQQSRVYARIRDSLSEFSLLSGDRQGQSWSMLSGVDLNSIAMSRLSVFALPLTLQDVENSTWYRQNLWRGLEYNIFRIAVLGDGGVGKSTLVSRLCYGSYTEIYDATIEDEHSVHTIVDGQVCRIDITDCAGTHEYSDLREEAIARAEGFVIVYSITSASSFELVREHHEHVIRIKGTEPTPPIVIVGSKSDTPWERNVNRQSGWVLATELACDFAECSAKTGADCQGPFHDVVRAIRAARGG
ncbi:P-loop containing nucleoside triphosphate hydrolase protein [Xylariaceae sp. FL0804]|nr:P-loop containing nucleoside triphosphate hydrolase protein [Xylariaceae sp. FL0804]